MVEVAVRRARHDINFQFAVATRAGAIIQIAIRPDTRLAIFILSGKLQPDPGLACATPEKAAVQCDARDTILRP